MGPVSSPVSTPSVRAEFTRARWATERDRLPRRRRDRRLPDVFAHGPVHHCDMSSHVERCPRSFLPDSRPSRPMPSPTGAALAVSRWRGVGSFSSARRLDLLPEDHKRTSSRWEVGDYDYRVRIYRTISPDDGSLGGGDTCRAKARTRSVRPLAHGGGDHGIGQV